MRKGSHERLSTHVDKPTCCVSQRIVIQMIAITSTIFEVTIALIAYYGYHETAGIFREAETEPTTLSKNSIIVNLLIYVCFSSIVASLLLLYFKALASAMKIWTMTHVGSAVAIILIFWTLFKSKEVVSELFNYLFIGLGVHFCTSVFFILIMVEFLLNPWEDKSADNEESSSSSDEDQNASSSICRQRFGVMTTEDVSN